MAFNQAYAQEIAHAVGSCKDANCMCEHAELSCVVCDLAEGVTARIRTAGTRNVEYLCAKCVQAATNNPKWFIITLEHALNKHIRTCTTSPQSQI